MQRKAGLKAGDRLEFKVSGSVITITPTLPSANDEYSPEQRKVIDARLDIADQDINAGRVHGRFASAKEVGKYIEGLVKGASIG